MKKKWKLLQPNIESLKSTDIPDFIKQLLVNRRIDDPEIADKFLTPSPEDLHDSFLIQGMDRAVSRILKAVKDKEKVFIYGDYDVDGVTATSILWECLRYEFNADVYPYIPHRVNEGYGLNRDAIEEIIAQGTSLIITVDCGIRDFELVEKYKGQVDFIISDHHTIPEVLPDTITLHARHPDGDYPFGEISGGVMAWKLAQALRRESGIEDLEKINNGIDLAALSTVCDVMPLIDENRVIVKYGLEEIRKSSRVGLLQMLKDAGVSREELDSYHLGFVIGPRINASGRLDHALDAVRLLVTQNREHARHFSKKLGDLNIQRQDITLRILEEAEAQVFTSQLEQNLLFVYGENWPEGVVGLVAGRLTEKYHKPSLVASIKGNEAVGSARSISVFNVVEAIGKSKDKLIRFGGHAQAAGFTLHKDNIDDFRDSLQFLAKEIIKEEDILGELEIDAELELSLATFDSVNLISNLKPFGYGNGTPTFLTRNVEIIAFSTLGKGDAHLKLIVSDGECEIECIAFRMGERLGEIEIGKKVDIVYNLDINEWNGRRSIQLKVKDFSFE